METDISTLRDAAHYYRRQGIAVTPLKPKAKIPTQKRWAQSPFPTESEIDEWFSRGHNIGIRTGQASRNIFVVDIDAKDDGFTAWEAIVGADVVPDTERVETPGGGMHIYLKTPDGCSPPKNSAGKLAKGVDLRGEGGQVVAPPSPTDKGSYELYDDPDRELIEIDRIAECPDWLWDIIKRSTKQPQGAAKEAKSANDGKHAPRLILEGERNDAMARLAGSLVNKGLGIETVRLTLLSHNEHRCIPPLDTDEIDRIIQQAGTWTVQPGYDEVWLQSLQKTAKGETRGTMSNVLLFLRNDPRLTKLWRYNRLNQTIEVHRSPPWEPPVDPDTFQPREWTEDDVSDFRCWLADEHKLGHLMQEPSKEAVQDAVSRHCKSFSYHPIQEYLNRVIWDGEPRIDYFFADYCGSPQDEYSSWVGRVLFIGAAKRMLEPGCIHRMMPVLVGPQNQGKSNLIGRLAKDRWATSMSLDFKDKDAIMGMTRHWLIELAELAALRRTREIEIVKDFISRREDTYRAPWGRRTQTDPRACVFIGTSNSREFLQAGEEQTRFLPIDTPNVALDALEDGVVDQLWAEAVQRARDGEQWWEPPDGAKPTWQNQIESHKAADSWTDTVLEYAESPGSYSTSQGQYEVTTAEIWTEALNGALNRITRQEEMRIGQILRDAGFEKRQARRGGRKKWLYTKEV